MSDCAPIRIHLTVEGGFAGLVPRTFTVDSAALPEPAAADLQSALTDACNAPPPEPELSGAPDVFVYHLTVIGPEVPPPGTFDDITASPALRTLVARVQELAAGEAGT